MWRVHGTLTPVIHTQTAFVYVTLIGCAAAGTHSTTLLLPRKEPAGNCCSSRSQGAEQAVGSAALWLISITRCSQGIALQIKEEKTKILPPTSSSL